MNQPALLERVPPNLRRRPVLLVVAGLVVLVLLAWILRPRNTSASTAYHEVRKGDFTVSIVEGGTLTAVSEVSIRNEVEGTSRIIYIVPEGSYVKKGDLLVELDSAQAQDQINQQNINVEKAQFSLIQAQAQLDIQRSTTNSDIRAAVLKLRFAQLDLEKFDQGQQVVDLVEASNKLVQAEAQLSVNLDNYVNSSNLATKGYETKQRLDSDRLSVMNTRNSLIVASNQLWMLKKFDLAKLREKYESDVREAEQELTRVVAQSTRRIAQYEADLITQSNTLALSQRKLDRDRKNLDACKVNAPQDGLVVYPVGENRFSQESLIEEGAVVRNRQELIKLPDTARMKVTVKVHESHVNMVRPGLPAYVVLDSMPDVRFAAVVEKVGLLPDTSSRWGNPNLKVYNTDVHITDQLPDIKPGVSAKAEIIITNISDSLSVPIQAVTTLKGRQVIYLANGASGDPKPVEVGMYNTKFIQVLSGVSAGERVLLAPPFDSEERDIEGAVLAENEKSAAAKTNRPRPSASTASTNLALNGSRPPNGPGPGNGNGNGNGNGSPRDDRAAPAGPAANGNTDGAPGGGNRQNRAGFNPQELAKQFDKDGDGQLNEEEREAMRTAMTARAGQGGQSGPGGGRGRMNREEMMKQFDKDGDGQLSEEETAAMRQSFGGSRTNRSDRADRPRGNRDGGNGGGENRQGGRERTDAPEQRPAASPTP
ncbi:MAG: HlyD family efflux transporter periplasmic adaptor subunit [Verrucomicrobiales bacterium]|nr:HlyD family efflux transporter periplasmic adaptor subunit [Verrucomicrobiales bacterium]